MRRSFLLACALCVLSLAACQGGSEGSVTSSASGSTGAGTGGGAPEVTCPVTASVPNETSVTLTEGVGWYPLSAPIDPPKGVTVKACGLDDGACAHPYDTEPFNSTSVVKLTVPTPPPVGFIGYFELTGGAPQPIVPMIWAGSVPIHVNGFGSFQVLTPTQQGILLALAKTTFDTSRGALGTVIFGCDGAPGAGFTVEVSTADSRSTIGYFGTTGAPDPTATSTHKSPLATGTAYAINIPPGRATLTARDPTSGLRLATRDVWFRAGFFTEINLSPTP